MTGPRHHGEGLRIELVLSGPGHKSFPGYADNLKTLPQFSVRLQRWDI